MYLIDLITRFSQIQEVSLVSNKVIPTILHKKTRSPKLARKCMY